MKRDIVAILRDEDKNIQATMVVCMDIDPSNNGTVSYQTICKFGSKLPDWEFYVQGYACEPFKLGNILNCIDHKTVKITTRFSFKIKVPSMTI